VFYQFYLVIEEAERWAYGAQMKRQADATAFLRFAVDRVEETDLQL